MAEQELRFDLSPLELPEPLYAAALQGEDGEATVSSPWAGPPPLPPTKEYTRAACPPVTCGDERCAAALVASLTIYHSQRVAPVGRPGWVQLVAANLSGPAGCCRAAGSS